MRAKPRWSPGSAGSGPAIRPSSARPTTRRRSASPYGRGHAGSRPLRRPRRPARGLAEERRDGRGARAAWLHATPPASAGGRGAGLSSGGPLPCFTVRRVAAAPAAVLSELDAVGRVPLRLGRLVVAPLALRACERDSDSDSGCHLSSLG